MLTTVCSTCVPQRYLVCTSPFYTKFCSLTEFLSNKLGYPDWHLIFVLTVIRYCPMDQFTDSALRGNITKNTWERLSRKDGQEITVYLDCIRGWF